MSKTYHTSAGEAWRPENAHTPKGQSQWPDEASKTYHTPADDPVTVEPAAPDVVTAIEHSQNNVEAFQ